MGAVVVTIANPGPDAVDYFGSRKVVFGTLHLSASYATGGDNFTNSQFGLERLDFLDISAPAGGSGVTTSWVYAPAVPNATGGSAAGFIQAFGSLNAVGALDEAPAGTNLSTFVASFVAYGF